MAQLNSPKKAPIGNVASQIIGHQQNLQRLSEMMDQGRLPPVLLFLGPEGIGKKLVALALGQRLVCDNQNACGKCGPCLRVQRRESETVRIISPDGAHIKVEQARQIMDDASLQSTGRARVWILDQADKLNPNAANSLLKTFEEPPPQTYFILLTSSQSRVLPTIRSRSQVVRFSSLTQDELRKIRTAPEWAYISAQGQVSRLDQLTQPSYDELRKKSFHLMMSAARESQTWASLQIKELVVDRETGLQVLSFWQQFLRDWNVRSLALQPLIHQDLFREVPHQIEDSAYESLHQELQQADRDLSGNIDRTLVFENLCRRMKATIA